jgi:hypothetical protein
MLKTVLSTSAGLLLMLFVMVDVFMTVLYARVQAGCISKKISSANWLVFRTIGKLFKNKRMILSFAGPVGLVLLVATWVSLLMAGSALVIWPRLGHTFVATQGATHTDFGTALYLAGDALSTVGASDISPRNPAARLFYMLSSLLGLSILTLTITYYLEIYNSLQHRNTFAIKLHSATGETGDAAELLAGLMPQGEVQLATSLLSEFAAEMTAFEEAHHFYPVMFYFEFREPHYANSRVLLLCLDLVALVKTCLDDKQYSWLKECIPVSQLGRTSRRMLDMIAETYLGSDDPGKRDNIEDKMRKRWERRHAVAIERLRSANIAVVSDVQKGAEDYVKLRREWDAKILNLARHSEHEFSEIDRWGQDPEQALDRAPFHDRQRKPE